MLIEHSICFYCEYVTLEPIKSGSWLVTLREDPALSSRSSTRSSRCDTEGSSSRFLFWRRRRGVKLHPTPCLTQLPHGLLPAHRIFLTLQKSHACGPMGIVFPKGRLPCWASTAEDNIIKRWRGRLLATLRFDYRHGYRNVNKFHAPGRNLHIAALF